MSVAQVVTLARAWIGTPYVHQGARRGAGCDCLGLLRGVMAEARGKPLQSVPAYTPDWSEPQGDEVLWTEAARQLIAKPIEHAEAGDVLLFRMRQGAVAKHVGLQAEIGLRSTFIHAYQGHGVRESAFSTPWQRRLVARFAVPDFT
ncbi:putative phage cell wall peptidase, NlpC/P60 family [Octadecabacter temperatus]|uniref:NlpC/P60 family protein n=1 Tax=Octadecabacter temperatus TaxID=1458307 RepID=A0A0K0Y6L0_9RHOB|nr:NlpC/P60 family protein [Octadecabacter temperatus]SIO14901.1 putative phage cell wall peptidase, NlpC/P60 family [Octadecabacter temperatus]